MLAGSGGKPWARLGIVVAKKNVRLAVARNRLKRIVRESFRQQQDSLQGLDVVVIIKKDFASRPDATNVLPDLLLKVGNKCCKS